MEKTNIFTAAKPVNVEWFYFKEVGDQVQGTYVKKVVGLKDSFENDQIVYELSTPTGIKRIGFRVPQKINRDMDYVNLGQIVGFKFVSTVKWMNPKLHKEQDVKNIQVFADPKIVDQEWLDTRKNIEVVTHETVATPDLVEGEGSVIEADEVPGFGDFENPIPEVKEEVKEPAKTVKKVKTKEEQLVEIAELAKVKLGIVDPSKVKDAVMEETGLAFISSNYAKIIVSLNNIEV